MRPDGGQDLLVRDKPDSDDPVPFTANGVTKTLNADSSGVIENVPAQDDGSVDVTMD